MTGSENRILYLPSILEALIGLLLFAHPLTSKADEKSLPSLQSAQAQALTQYYKELVQNGGSMSNASQSFNSSVGPALNQFSAYADERLKQNDNRFFNRVFLSDGSSVEASLFNANPDKYLKSAAEANAQKTLSNSEAQGNASTPQNPGTPPGGNETSGGTHGKIRPEYTLDGSQIPKEIQFSPPIKE